MSLISIIIPNFNSEKWLSFALDSCIQQVEFIKEIIIIDDFSEDNSWEILLHYQLQYPEVVKVYKNTIKGGNNARNYGYSLSTGEYIQWLDADDQILSYKFEKQLKVLESNKSIDIVYSDWELRMYDSYENLLATELKKKKQYKDFLYELLIDNWSAPNNYLIRRSMAEKLHLIKAWAPNTKVGQDREYFTIAALIGAKFVYVKGCFSIYNRWNSSSISRLYSLKDKYECFDEIFNRFEEIMYQMNWISPAKLNRYQRIINTQKLFFFSAGFNSNINHGRVTILNTSWLLIKGVRTILKMIKSINKIKQNEKEN